MDDEGQGIQRGAEALDKFVRERTPEQQQYIERGYGAKPAPRERLKVIRACDVKRQSIEWLLEGKIALGKITLIAGDPGLGKSMVTINLAAHVSTGMDWPGEAGPCPLGDALLFSAEDDPGDTVRPRLEAAEADLARVHIVGGVELNKGGTLESRLLSLRQDIELIRQAALALPRCLLIVIDPISAYLDGADSHNNAEVRSFMAPLSDLASSLGAAIVLVTHLNKSTGGQALHRATGSLAFVAAARAAFLVARDKDDPDRRFFLPLKNNLGPDVGGMAYRIEEVEGVPRVVWEEEGVLKSADDALGREMATVEHETTRIDRAADWLSVLLSNGPVPVVDIAKEAKGAGHAWATVRRGQDKLGIKPQYMTGVSGKKRSHWALPDPIAIPKIP